MNKTSKPKVSQAIKLFREYCSKKKMRYTPERETIIRAIYGSNGHFNVDNLFSRIRTRNPHCSIAKTSIYRSVPHFLEAGLLRESAAGGQVLYERTLGHESRDHFRCIGCGKIVEFSSPQLSLAQEKICKAKKFTILWRTNMINGYCRECREGRSR